MSLLLEALFAFFLPFFVFLPLEKLFSAKKQKIFRKEYFTDLLFFMGQFFVFTTPVVFALFKIDSILKNLPIQNFRQHVADLPFWLQILLVIFLADFCIYWGHRLQHKIPFLWRFHKVHHTAEHMDWLAAFREHPLDNLYTRTIENFPVLLLGFELQTLAAYVTFRGLWGMFIHSNVTLSPGPLKYILGSPRLHHWHHDKSLNRYYNFSNLMPIMDVLFGTYFEPKREPKTYGIHEKVSHNYFWQLLSPLFPKFKKSSKRKTVNYKTSIDLKKRKPQLTSITQ